MKKLLFIALFSIGLYSVSNAQFVIYTATNSGIDTWEMGMANAGMPGVATYELAILPTEVRTGVIGPGFAFPFEFKAGNQNGCGTYQFVPATTNGVFVPIACGTPTSLKYRLELLIPFIVWEFEVKFG